MTGLGEYVAAVDWRVEGAIADHDAFHPHQQALLRATIAAAREGVARNPLGHPLSALYLIAQANGRTMDAQAVHVGTFCLLYILSLDLFDDVQDDDLAGKPHAAAGPAIAINSALALNFLAMLELRRAMELAQDTRESIAYLELYNRVSLAAVAGQHRDLLGMDGAETPDQVLAMQQAKTSSVLLLTECGALLGRCPDTIRARYRAIGEWMAKFIQIRDDLRDVFGKPFSPDLATGKVSYPVACLLEGADDLARARFASLVSGLPGSMQALRTFLYGSGAVEASAAMLEGLREQIHDEIAGMERGEPHHRTLLDVIDSLALGVYRALPLESTARFWSPSGAWHEAVREELNRFSERMAPLRMHPAPTLRPWHLSHWMYMPDRDTIFYPDIEGLPRETLPFHSAVLGIPDLDEVAAIIRAELPALLAHEMFHRWRALNRRITRDHWHEEWAANHLMVAYCMRFEPGALSGILVLAESVLARCGGVSAADEAMLTSSSVERSGASGYGMDAAAIAVVSFEMVRRIATTLPTLESSLASLLGGERGRTASA